jgi:hypothetical protein
MKNQIKHLPLELRQMAEKHFVLLESQNLEKKRDTIQLNVSGYSDVMFLIADLVKVCILALEGDTSFKQIPEPRTNISGVLFILLDLLPYEEAELLDYIRSMVLQPAAATMEEELGELDVFLRAPEGLYDGVVVFYDGE